MIRHLYPKTSLEDKIYACEEISDFARENKLYAEGIKSDVRNFINTTDEKIITSEKPFDYLLDLFEDVSRIKKKEFLSIWKHIADYINENSRALIDISFFERELSVKFNAARRFFMRIWREELKKSESLWERSFIESELEKFIFDMCEKIANLKLISKTFSLSKEDAGRFWNTSRGKWQNTNYNIIAEYEKVYKSDLRLVALAKNLGRARLIDADSDTPPSELLYLVKEEGGAKAELCGITVGSALDSLVPSEFVFLVSNQLEPIFFDKWAKKKLLCYEYCDSTPIYGINGDASCKKRYAEGPFIICIDSSGSMRGNPERAAKAIVFALLKCALKTKRLCYLISFSTEIATLELSSLDNSLDSLIDFLSNSFYGGSQLIPALNESLNLLERESYRAADILVVSDFILPPLDSEIENKMKAAQAQGTRFYALLTGSLEDSVVNLDIVNLFDNCDIYDIF